MSKRLIASDQDFDVDEYDTEDGDHYEAIDNMKVQIKKDPKTQKRFIQYYKDSWDYPSEDFNEYAEQHYLSGGDKTDFNRNEATIILDYLSDNQDIFDQVVSEFLEY